MCPNDNGTRAQAFDDCACPLQQKWAVSILQVRACKKKWQANSALGCLFALSVTEAASQGLANPKSGFAITFSKDSDFGERSWLF